VGETNTGESKAIRSAIHDSAGDCTEVAPMAFDHLVKS